MPDLTIQSGFWCASNEYWEARFPKSKGDGHYLVRWMYTPFGDYQYGWDCECPGFKYNTRHECKHTKAAEGMRCGWNAEMEPGMVPDPGPKCPMCGGPVKGFRVGV